jgi:ribosomal protein S18 acetylase RimI-like enzyme
MDMSSLREIGAMDKDRLTRFHSRLSAEARYRRYHGAKGALTGRELIYLTEIDGHDHVAVVAEDGDGVLGAVARVVSNGDGTAEVAVVVADDSRGRGLGGGVVRAAVRRYVSGSPGDVVLAHVQQDNRAAMRLFVDRLGGRPIRYEDGVAIVRLPASTGALAS